MFLRTCLNLSRKKCWRVGHSFPFNHRPTAVLTVFSPQDSYDFAFCRFAFILFLSYILLLLLPVLSASACLFSLPLSNPPPLSLLLSDRSNATTEDMFSRKAIFNCSYFIITTVTKPFFFFRYFPMARDTSATTTNTKVSYSIVYSTRNLPQSTLTWEYPR